MPYGRLNKVLYTDIYDIVVVIASILHEYHLTAMC